ncbi:MAG: hypothetical protein ABSA01_07735 [Anaerolineales bacterium]
MKRFILLPLIVFLTLSNVTSYTFAYPSGPATQSNPYNGFFQTVVALTLIGY